MKPYPCLYCFYHQDFLFVSFSILSYKVQVSTKCQNRAFIYFVMVHLDSYIFIFLDICICFISFVINNIIITTICINGIKKVRNQVSKFEWTALSYLSFLFGKMFIASIPLFSFFHMLILSLCYLLFFDVVLEFRVFWVVLSCHHQFFDGGWILLYVIT